MGTKRTARNGERGHAYTHAIFVQAELPNFLKLRAIASGRLSYRATSHSNGCWSDSFKAAEHTRVEVASADASVNFFFGGGITFAEGIHYSGRRVAPI